MIQQLFTSVTIPFAVCSNFPLLLVDSLHAPALGIDMNTYSSYTLLSLLQERGAGTWSSKNTIYAQETFVSLFAVQVARITRSKATVWIFLNFVMSSPSDDP